MTDLNLLAVCGLYCGACYHYRASLPGGERLLQEATRRGRPLEGYTCRGCRSEVRYAHPGCAACAIRACAEAKGILHCGECAGFPCQQLRSFQSDGRVHHLSVLEQLTELSRTDPGQWLAEQAERWTCACGTPFSWYETTCSHCGARLHSYGPDPTV
jgi:hypothetical protein